MAEEYPWTPDGFEPEGWDPGGWEPVAGEAEPLGVILDPSATSTVVVRTATSVTAARAFVSASVARTIEAT